MLPVPLRVALTIGPSGYGGIATYSRELAIALARRTDVALVTVGSRVARDELAALRDHESRGGTGGHVELADGRLVGQLGVLTLRRQLVVAGVHVFHGTRHMLPLFSPVPTVLTFHDDFAVTRRGDYDVLKRVFLPGLYRRTLRSADAVVTLAAEMSPLAGAYARAGVPIVNAGAAAPSVLTDAVAVRPATRLPERYALVVGDCSPRKNVESLLDAWDAVDTATGLALVVAGGRSASPALRARLADGPRRVLVAEPSWGELAELYAAAALVVEPSAAEGFGFPRAEAAHFGRPYLPLHDVADIGAAIRDALEADARGTARDLGRAPDWDEVADRTAAVYRAVACRSSSRSRSSR